MMESPRRQAESEGWPQAVGPLVQAEIEKAIVQGLTSAFRTLAERLPQLLAEARPNDPPPPSHEAPALSLVSPWSPCGAAETTEQPAATETTIVDSTAAPAEPCEASPPQTARIHYRRGREAEQAGDLESAIAHFTEVVRLAPEVASGYLARGRLLRRLGRTDDVLADAERALHLDPDLAAAYYLRAAAHLRHGDNSQAIADLTRFLARQPDHALAHQARGLARANEGDYESAIADYGRALRLEPKLLSTRYQRAIAYRLKGDYVVAVVELTKILALRPDFARAYFERALARLALEEYDRAIEDFDKAVALTPEDEEVRIRREQALQAREQSRTASPDAPSERSPSPPPALPPDPAENSDPTFLPLNCPACGAAARISWKHLDRLFRCRQCARVFRVNREGVLREIDPKPKVSRRSFLMRRGAAAGGVLALLLVLAVCGYARWRPRPALAELPNDLPSRGELWGKAWLNNDRLLLRRLTSPSHDRQLHPWLLRHPPPSDEEKAASPPPEIHLRVQKTKANQAILIVRITGAALKDPREFRLDWVEQGEAWNFVPSLRR
jgi:Flp pilus assembly protein TadD